MLQGWTRGVFDGLWKLVRHLLHHRQYLDVGIPLDLESFLLRVQGNYDLRDHPVHLQDLQNNEDYQTLLSHCDHALDSYLRS